MRTLARALVLLLTLVLPAHALDIRGGGSATPSGPAGGDLTGTYPNPTVGKIGGLVGLILGNGASAPTAYAGTTCTNQFVRALSAVGLATCNTVNLASDVTGTLPTTSFPALTGDVTTPGGSLATTLKNTGPGVTSCGDATHSCSETIDAQGRVTALSNNSITSGVGGSGTLNTIPAFTPNGTTLGNSNLTNNTSGVDVGAFQLQQDAANDTVTGTSPNHVVKWNGSGKAVITAALTTDPEFGICVNTALNTCGTSGTGTFAWYGQVSCVFPSGVTQGDWVGLSGTVAGDCLDTGVAATAAPPTGITVIGQVLSATNAAAGTYTIFLHPFDLINPTNNGGKSTAIQTNGTNTKVTANFNNTTPTAQTNNTNVSWQASNSGNTTSISAEVDSTAFGPLTFTGPRKANCTVSPSTTGSVAASTCYERVTAGAGGVTRTLPAATGTQRIIDIAKVDSAAGAVTVSAAGGDLINGSANQSLANQYEGVTLIDAASGVWDLPTETSGAATNALTNMSGASAFNVVGLATETVAAWKPTRTVVLNRITGVVTNAGTCAACGVTDHTWRVTDGTTNSDCTNASAILCTAAAGTTFTCNPTGNTYAAASTLKLQAIATGGTCTTEPQLNITAEFAPQ